MTEFKQIWTFVERKLKIEIPPYIKNVLKYCGYENSHTIATIEEHDFEYFSSEIRKGDISVKKFFKGEILEDDILEGSIKSFEDFEFSRGHQKLLMAAVKLIKDELEENGVSGFSLASPKKKTAKKTAAKTVQPVCRKRMKFSNRELLKETNDTDEELGGLDDHSEDPIERHKKSLFIKALNSLKNHNSESYVEKLKFFKNKLSGAAIQVTIKSKDQLSGKLIYKASIKCPYCDCEPHVFHKISTSVDGSWNVFNFYRHLELLHKEYKANDRIKTENDDETCERSVENEVKDVDTKTNKEIEQSSIEDEGKDPDEDGEKDDLILIVLSSADQSSNSDQIFVKDYYGEDTIENFSTVLYEDVKPYVESSDEKIEPTNMINVENIPIFQNGRKTKCKNGNEMEIIKTQNTCAFDSIFAIYAFLYFDDASFRSYIDVGSFFFHTEFTELVDLYFATTTSTPISEESSEAWKALYYNRNKILKHVFSSKYYANSPNLTLDQQNDENITFINCRTGLGEFFVQLSNETEIIASAIENRICLNCKIIKGKIVPFLSTDSNLDITNIQKNIDSYIAKDRICNVCKKKCNFDRMLNNVVVLHVEPSNSVRNKQKVSLQKISQTIKLEKREYKLCGAIEFVENLSHFVAHVRLNGDWIVFDDLKRNGIESNERKEILPFILFYAAESKCNRFKEALSNKPLNKEILTKDPAYGISADSMKLKKVGSQDRSIIPKQSTTSKSVQSNMELTRREMGWKKY